MWHRADQSQICLHVSSYLKLNTAEPSTSYCSETVLVCQITIYTTHCSLLVNQCLFRYPRMPSGVQSTLLIDWNWQLPTCDCLWTSIQMTHSWVMGDDQRFVEFLRWGMLVCLLGWEEMEVVLVVVVGGTRHFQNKQLLCQWWLVNRCPSHHPCASVPLSMIYSF